MENESWITGNITLKVGDIPIDIELTVPAQPVKPMRMLPVFQKMANSIVELSENAVVETGETISCTMGCGACCRQPVPIAEVEAYQLAELVDNLPEPRQTVIRERFKAAVEHFNSIGWFQRIVELSVAARMKKESNVAAKLIEHVMSYFHEGIPCPFLEDESCSIHESRPLACREYLVTSPAENCSKPTSETIRKVPLLLNPSNAMKRVGQTGLQAKWGIIPLIRALECAATIPESFAEKTGERWAAEFFEHLTNSKIPEGGIDT